MQNVENNGERKMKNKWMEQKRMVEIVRSGGRMQNVEDNGERKMKNRWVE